MGGEIGETVETPTSFAGSGMGFRGRGLAGKVGVGCSEIMWTNACIIRRGGGRFQRSSLICGVLK